VKVNNVLEQESFKIHAKIAACVDPGGVGSNTINKAGLTGMASALRAKCTHIATDSASSLPQVRK